MQNVKDLKCIQAECQDVDVVLTTRELSRILKEAVIDLSKLPDEEYDEPLGISTGAGAIFAATGGVMEAALELYKNRDKERTGKPRLY